MAKHVGSEMEGGTYLYNAEQYTIQTVQHYEDDLYDVYTDKRRIRVNKADLGKLFKRVLLPARTNGYDSELVALLKQENKPTNDLITKLDKLIDRIDKGEVDFKKAKAINETARSIIQARKTQIDLYKLAKKRGG
jgi:hypothetical protein